MPCGPARPSRSGRSRGGCRRSRPPLAGQFADERPAAYLDVHREDLAVTLTREPGRAELPVPFDEQLLVEFYSR